ncbi:hypothetical protein [uncultured Cardiobacterium sp.]|uniref:hypothetical protein n=1 Tax=uncultured Cardiobacterium sp. TaxID=417619 RepID=UPI002607AB88|nr:hypothetical protein [uncultured Cardiobacterium sp.]
METINLKLAPTLGVGYDWIVFLDDIEKIMTRLGIPIDKRGADNFIFNNFKYEKFKLGSKFDECYKSVFEEITLVEFIENEEREPFKMRFRDGRLIEIFLGEGWEGEIFGIRIGQFVSEKRPGIELVFDTDYDEFVVHDASQEEVFGIAVWPKMGIYSSIDELVIDKISLYGHDDGYWDQ